MNVHVQLTGVSGLVMHNGRLADPLDPIAMQLSELADKRDRTPTEEIELGNVEWHGSIYYDKETGPYIPSANIIRSFRDAATAWRLGERVWDAVSLEMLTLPLLYEGSRDIAILAKQDEFRWRTTIKLGRIRTPRTRPIFRRWRLEFDLELAEEELSFPDLVRITERAGRFEGLGDARKLGFGRYLAQVTA